MVCQKIKKIIEEEGFKDAKIVEDSEEECVIDFRHPKVKVELPAAYFLSSVAYNKKQNFLSTTVRSKVDSFKEIYLEACCENGTNVCRPHVNMEERILSVEATFSKEPLERFRELLREML